MSEKTQRVIVAPGRIVYAAGGSHGFSEGMALELPAAHAEELVAGEHVVVDEPAGEER